jgi:hypothetical protein
VSDRSDLRQVLADLAGLLEAQGLRWLIFGAQAVVLFGRPRLTADLDVTVDLQPEHAGAFLPALTEAGFRTRVADVEAFVARTRVLPVEHRATGFPVDLVLAGPGLETDFLARARRVDVGGLDVPVISPEDLLVTKLLAGRPQDLDDARGVLERQAGRLDLERVRDLLVLLEQALDRSDLVRELERMKSARC